MTTGFQRSLCLSSITKPHIIEWPVPVRGNPWV